VFLKGQCLDRRIPDMTTIKAESAAGQKDRDNRAKAISWHYTTDDARIKPKRLYPII